MIARAEAAEIARRWLSRDDALVASSEVGLYEFDLGWVFWKKPPPGPRRDPRDGPPDIVGGPNAVIDAETGELSVWPSLSPQAVAELYRKQRRAEGRFPADVREVLAETGWQPTRNVSSWVSLWLADVHEQHPTAQGALPLFPTARNALAEFGGLRFTQPSSVQTGGFRVELWPRDRRVPVELFAGLQTAIGVPVFPLAWCEDGPSHLALDETGRAFLLHPSGLFLVAGTVDEAITALVRGLGLSSLTPIAAGLPSTMGGRAK